MCKQSEGYDIRSETPCARGIGESEYGIAANCSGDQRHHDRHFSTTADIFHAASLCMACS